LQETIDGLGHVAGYLESLLVSVYAREQYVYNVKFPLLHNESTTSDVRSQKFTTCHYITRIRENMPVSLLRLASRVPSGAKTEHLVNFVDLEKQERCHAPVEATNATQFQIEVGTLSGRALS
jgi:hypothetical protein